MSSKIRITTLALLFFQVMSVAAQQEVTVRLPRKMQVEAWVLPRVPDRMPAAGRKFDAAEFVLPIADARNDVIIVKDASANVAMRSVATIKENTWRVQDAEWRIGQIAVEVISRSGIAPIGTVKAKGKTYVKDQPIMPSGRAFFFAVPVEDIDFTVSYSVNGVRKNTEPVRFRLSLKHLDEVPTFPIAIAADADGQQRSPQPPPPSKEGNASPLVNLLITAMGLLVALAALYALLRWMTANPAKVEAKLRQLGVEPPKPQETEETPIVAQATPPIVEQGHCAFCGKPETECICHKSTTTRPFRLAAKTGTIDLQVGTHILGREGTIPLSDPSVSRRHCEMMVSESTIVIKDLGSANGTYVNGERVEGDRELRVGDRLQLGALELKVE